MSRLSRLGPLWGLLLVAGFFWIAAWAHNGQNTFGTAANLGTIALQSTVVGTTALGMTLVIIAGGIDLSVGAIVALASVVVALLLRAGAPGPAAAAAAVAVGACCGLLNGSLVAGARIVPFIVTLGTMLMIRGAAKEVADNQSVQAAVNPFDGFLSHRGPGLWILGALAVGVALLLRYTRFGRHVVAVGSNEAAARLCGVPVARTKILVYVLGGAFAGLSGLFQFSRLSQGDPTSAPGHELDVVAAVVIGGASLSGGEGSILGSLVGALIMTTIRNGCSQMDWANSRTEIVAGAIIIAAAALDRLRHRM